MLIALALVACTPHMEDNSLESPTLSGDIGDGESGIEVTGVLTATPGTGDGDWTLQIEQTTLYYHSPSHVDLGSLSGETVTLASQPSYSGPPGLTISDASGPRFVEDAGTGWDGAPGEDGSTAFGHAVWARGDVIGKGVVIDSNDEEQDVRFTDVVVTDDAGEQTLLPGEPTSLTIDGNPWRFTVIAAFLAINAPNLKCGAPDLLVVELIRTDADPGPALKRPTSLKGPVGTCG